MLKGNKIYLRAMEPSDVDFLYSVENDPSNWRISQTMAPFSRHVLSEFANSTQDIHAHKQMRFIICENETERAVGTIDLFDYDAINLRAGIGVLIQRTDDRSKGFGEEALNLMLNFGFNQLLLHSLYCNILEDNVVSINLFEKLGFEKIGLKKDWINTEHGWKNEYTLQILNQ